MRRDPSGDLKRGGGTMPQIENKNRRPPEDRVLLQHLPKSPHYQDYSTVDPTIMPDLPFDLDKELPIVDETPSFQASQSADDLPFVATDAVDFGSDVKRYRPLPNPALPPTEEIPRSTVQNALRQARVERPTPAPTIPKTEKMSRADIQAMLAIERANRGTYTTASDTPLPTAPVTERFAPVQAVAVQESPKESVPKIPRLPEGMSLEDFTRLETLAAEPEEERNGVILSRANALIDTRNTERSRARTIVDVIRKGDFDTAQQLLGRKQVVETPGAAKLSAQEKAADPLERAKRTLMREIQRAGLDKPFTSPAELNTTLRHLHMKTGAEASIPVGEPFTAQVKEGGFFSKLLGGGEKERTFQLYMTPDGQASRVEYIGADSNDPKVQKQYKQYIP